MMKSGDCWCFRNSAHHLKDAIEHLYCLSRISNPNTNCFLQNQHNLQIRLFSTSATTTIGQNLNFISFWRNRGNHEVLKNSWNKSLVGTVASFSSIIHFLTLPGVSPDSSAATAWPPDSLSGPWAAPQATPGQRLSSPRQHPPVPVRTGHGKI